MTTLRPETNSSSISSAATCWWGRTAVTHAGIGGRRGARPVGCPLEWNVTPDSHARYRVEVGDVVGELGHVARDHDAEASERLSCWGVAVVRHPVVRSRQRRVVPADERHEGTGHAVRDVRK